MPQAVNHAHKTSYVGTLCSESLVTAWTVFYHHQKWCFSVKLNTEKWKWQWRVFCISRSSSSAQWASVKPPRPPSSSRHVSTKRSACSCFQGLSLHRADSCRVTRAACCLIPPCLQMLSHSRLLPQASAKGGGSKSQRMTDYCGN